MFFVFFLGTPRTKCKVQQLAPEVHVLYLHVVLLKSVMI